MGREDSRRAVPVKRNLADALIELGKFAEAEPLLVESHSILADPAQAIPPHLRELRVREALKRIVKLYESWDAAEPGKGYAEKAVQYRAKLPQPPAEDPSP